MYDSLQSNATGGEGYADSGPWIVTMSFSLTTYYDKIYL